MRRNGPRPVTPMGSGNRQGAPSNTNRSALNGVGHKREFLDRLDRSSGKSNSGSIWPIGTSSIPFDALPNDLFLAYCNEKGTSTTHIEGFTTFNGAGKSTERPHNYAKGIIAVGWISSGSGYKVKPYSDSHPADRANLETALDKSGQFQALNTGPDHIYQGHDLYWEEPPLKGFFMDSKGRILPSLRVYTPDMSAMTQLTVKKDILDLKGEAKSKIPRDKMSRLEEGTMLLDETLRLIGACAMFCSSGDSGDFAKMGFGPSTAPNYGVHIEKFRKLLFGFKKGNTSADPPKHVSQQISECLYTLNKAFMVIDRDKRDRIVAKATYGAQPGEQFWATASNLV